MTSFVHIGKQRGYQSFGEILCPHLLDGPIRVDYAEHGDMKILTEFFVHLPNLKASYDRRRKFLLTSIHKFILHCASSLEKFLLLCQERRLIFFSLIRLSAYSHNYARLPVYNKDIPFPGHSPKLLYSIHSNSFQLRHAAE